MTPFQKAQKTKHQKATPQAHSKPDLLSIALRRVKAEHPRMPAVEQGRLAAELALEATREFAAETSREPTPKLDSAEARALARRMGVAPADDGQRGVHHVNGRLVFGTTLQQARKFAHEGGE